MQGNRATGVDVGPQDAGASAREWTTRAFGMGTSKFEPVSGRGACGAVAYRVTAAARERAFSNPEAEEERAGTAAPR